jgi:hypothetical protein
VRLLIIMRKLESLYLMAFVASFILPLCVAAAALLREPKYARNAESRRRRFYVSLKRS